MSSGGQEVLLDERTVLAEEFTRIELPGTWCIYVAIPWALLRRLGIEPSTRRGRGLTGLLTFGWLFTSALLVALATGTLHVLPALAWLTIATAEGVLVAWQTGPSKEEVAKDYNALFNAFIDVEALRSYVGSAESLSAVTAQTAACGLLIGILVVLVPGGDWTQIPPGSLWLLLILLFLVGQFARTTASNVNEFRLISRQRLRLSAYRPIDSPVLQQFLRGSQQTARANGALAIIYLVYAFLLVPRDLALLLPLAAAVMGVCYGSIVANIVSARWLVGYLVAVEKSRRLAALGGQIDVLMAGVPDLSLDEERKLRLLRETYDATRDSPLTSPPLTAAGQVVRAAAVPTVAFIAVAAAEGYIERLLNEVLDQLGS